MSSFRNTGYRKFSNKKVQGFDSKREYLRYRELELLQKIGAISELNTQVKFEVIPACGHERAAHYVADFQYIEKGRLIVEDSKGFKTPDYILKRKLMLHVHGIAIKEV